MPLTFCKTFLYREEVGGGLYEHELDFLFRGEVAHDVEPFINPNEVSEIGYFTTEEIERLLCEKRDFFASWFPHVFQHMKA